MVKGKDKFEKFYYLLGIKSLLFDTGRYLFILGVGYLTINLFINEIFLPVLAPLGGLVSLAGAFSIVSIPIYISYLSLEEIFFENKMEEKKW